MIPIKKLTALLLALALLSFAGCSLLESDGPKVNVPGELEDFPAGTFNELNLYFVESMFADDIVTVFNSEDGSSFTVSSELNREVYGEECEHYLKEDVIESAPDDWQVESWSYLIDNDDFNSVQPYIEFRGSNGTGRVRFWLVSGFACTTLDLRGLTFKVSEEVIETVKAQYAELASAASERLTPQETVTRFFDYLNEQDAEGINSLLAKPLEKVEFARDLRFSADSVLDTGHIGNFPAEYYENPYSNRVVYVKLRRADTEKIEELSWYFYLIRESADSEWKIAAYGS